MARQPNQTLRCGRMRLCALVALASVCPSMSFAQPPLNEPMMGPPGPTMATTVRPYSYQPQDNPPQGYQTPPPGYQPPAIAPSTGPYSPTIPSGGSSYGNPPPFAPPAAPPPGANLPPPSPDDTVVDVRVEGNRTVATSKIVSHIHTYAN